MKVERMDDRYYITRKTSKKVFRNWFLVKIKPNNSQGIVTLSQTLFLPKELIGKKVRFKLELLDDKFEVGEDEL